MILFSPILQINVLTLSHGLKFLHFAYWLMGERNELTSRSVSINNATFTQVKHTHNKRKIFLLLFKVTLHMLEFPYRLSIIFKLRSSVCSGNTINNFQGFFCLQKLSKSIFYRLNLMHAKRNRKTSSFISDERVRGWDDWMEWVKIGYQIRSECNHPTHEFIVIIITQSSSPLTATMIATAAEKSAELAK